MRFWRYVDDALEASRSEIQEKPEQSQDGNLEEKLEEQTQGEPERSQENSFDEEVEEQTQEESSQSQEDSLNEEVEDQTQEESSQSQEDSLNEEVEEQTQEESSQLQEDSLNKEIDEQSQEELDQLQESSLDEEVEEQTQGGSSQSQENSLDEEVEEQTQGESSQSQENSLDEELEKQTQENKLSQDDPSIEREKLQQLRDKLKEFSNKKREQEELEKQDLEKFLLDHSDKEVEESKEEEYQLSEHTNQFLEQLQELPSFKDRNLEAGYAIDTNGDTELPDSMIRTLITKFLNQRFCKHNTNLNIGNNSLEKTKGFYKWEVKDVITHLETHQITKVFDDKYDYEYTGENANIPLSFYFDLSGSMSQYTNMLSIMAIELLKKNVKVLIGFNERVNVQIDSIYQNIDVKDLADILKSAGYNSFWNCYQGKEQFRRDPRVLFQFIDKNIDNYLLSKQAEKCVVFSDFDPISEVINLSLGSDVYWFCFESSFNRSDLSNFNGFIYKVRNAKDIVEGLIKVNENRFEALCYIDNPKALQRKIGGK